MLTLRNCPVLADCCPSLGAAIEPTQSVKAGKTGKKNLGKFLPLS